LTGVFYKEGKKKKEEKEQEDSRRANSHKLSNVSFQEAIPEETPD
jgi:hypothetical protein